MATLQEMLVQRQAQAAAKAAGAIPSPLDGIKKPPIGTLVAGMQSAVSSPDTVVAVIPAKEMDKERAASALGVFEDITLRRFIPRNLQKVEASNGFFYAENDEQLAELTHFAKTGKVKKVEQVTE